MFWVLCSFFICFCLFCCFYFSQENWIFVHLWYGDFEWMWCKLKLYIWFDQTITKFMWATLCFMMDTNETRFKMEITGAVQPNKYSINDLCIMRLWHGWVEIENKKWSQIESKRHILCRCTSDALELNSSILLFIFTIISTISRLVLTVSTKCAHRGLFINIKKVTRFHLLPHFHLRDKMPNKSEWQSQADA